MADTANSLIIKSFHLLGVYTQDDTIPGNEIEEALEILNELLDSYSSDDVLIPFKKQITFNLVVGQQNYTVGPSSSYDINENKIVIAEYCEIERNDVTYPIQLVPESYYYDSYKYDLLQTIPNYLFYQNDVDKTTLTFYPIPEFTYECRLWAKVSLSDVTLYSLFNEVPNRMKRFLKYDLARELSNYYVGSKWDQKHEMVYQELKENLVSANDQDLTIARQRQSYLIGAARVRSGF